MDLLEIDLRTGRNHGHATLSVRDASSTKTPRDEAWRIGLSHENAPAPGAFGRPYGGW
jgi:hypothetical protein